MKYLFKIGISSLLFIGAWGAGHSAGMLAKSYGFGENALWIIALILSVLVLSLDVFWYIKKSGTDKSDLKNQGVLFTTTTGISVLLFVILNGSKSISFLFAGWDIHLRLRNATDFMVFFVAFMLVSAILTIIAWIKYKKIPATPPRTGTATP
jgi:hypothetical protein